MRADMDDAAMVKTLIHEAAHVLLHQAPPGRDLPRPLKEVEAESVAYVVASVHGMPTDDYSFPYVAGWAGEDPDKAIRETQARVNVAAQAIIAESPAEHTGGSKPPGTDLALAHVRQLEGEAATAQPEPHGLRNGAVRHQPMAGRTSRESSRPAPHLPSRPIWLSGPWQSALVLVGVLWLGRGRLGLSFGSPGPARRSARWRSPRFAHVR